MDETLHETASVEEQPVSEAVTETPSATTDTTETTEVSTAEKPSFTTRTYAGKYTSADELERAYLESQREASRMAGELSALKRTPAAATENQPKWKQLESERNKWSQQLRRPDLSEQDRWQADEQVRLHDREIAYERAKHDMHQETTRSSASQRLEQDSLKVLSQYQADLNNTTSSLYQASADRYTQLVQAGYPEDVNTKALAVAYAAAVTGTTVSKAIQQDRSAMLKTLNKTARQAVVAGAGGPATVKPSGVTPKDIENMTDAEFSKYERSALGV